MTTLVVYEPKSGEVSRYVRHKTKAGWVDPLVKTHSGIFQGGLQGLSGANAIRVFLADPPEACRDAPDPKKIRRGQVV